VIPTPSTPGSTTTSARAFKASSATPTGGTATGGPFADAEAVAERLHQGPQAPEPNTTTPPPRWTLSRIRDTFAELADATLSGVWRWLQRQGLKLRSGVVQQFSPDPDYAAKLIDLEMVLWEARRYPRSVVAVFLDEMGYQRWPDPAADWAARSPVADKQEAGHGSWRLIGALNPFSGRVDYLDAYRVGRAKVVEFYGQLVEAYPQARRLYVIQDNWSIHKHEDVLAALAGWPQVEPVWLPTYAPWLNPIEKVWRWLRQDVLHLHRRANDWLGLRAGVRRFLDQFAQGSVRLLEYVGLRGRGRLAQMIHGP
jgi:hypothetical protein